MIRYLAPAAIDRPQWDALIERAPNGLIYALSWYLDLVAPGWAALVKEENERYVAVMPLPVQTKFGLRYLRQPVFAQQLGLFYLREPTPADWAAIGQLLRREFRFVTKYSFNAANNALLANNPLGLGGAAAYTYYLSLRPAYPELRARYHASRRRQLRQAEAHGLRVGPATDLNLLIRLFAENTAAKIPGLLGEAYEYPLLRALYAAALPAGRASLWQARTLEGEVTAMVLLWKFKNHLIYQFNASSKLGKEQRAISLILDEIFRHYAGQDWCFDFESPQLANLERFYGSFGSVRTPFLAVSYNRLPWPLRQLKAARTALVRYWPRRA